MRKTVRTSELLFHLKTNMLIADEKLNDNNIKDFIFRFNAVKEDIQLLYGHPVSMPYKVIMNNIDSSLYNKLCESYNAMISKFMEVNK